MMGGCMPGGRRSGVQRACDGCWLDEDGYAIPQTFTPNPELLEQVDAVIQGCPDGISVVFCDLVSGQRWSWNETRSYYIASIFKLPYSLWLFERADAGKSTWTEPSPSPPKTTAGTPVSSSIPNTEHCTASTS